MLVEQIILTVALKLPASSLLVTAAARMLFSDFWPPLTLLVSG